jgi:heptosyltransferase I
MRILLVKLSSLGDVIHNLPVATDIRRAYPHAVIDWVTEAPYAELVALHPAISRVFTVNLRALKRQWWQPKMWSQLFDDKATLAHEAYDLIIDTQGLVKSAVIASWANGQRHGFDTASIREPFAARWYQHTYAVSRAAHAVVRNRSLARLALQYADTPCDYGLASIPKIITAPYIVLLHATSRADKTWTQDAWVSLGLALNARGIEVVLPSGNAAEFATSRAIAAKLDRARAQEAMSLRDTASLLGNAQAVVGVDTGLTHLAVALARPTIGIYLTTRPALTGLYDGRDDRVAINLGGGTRDAAASVGVESVLSALTPLLAGISI